MQSIVSVITDAPNKEHLISHIKMPGTKAWYLFNDTLLSVARQVEALNINADWKFPLLVYYTRTNLDTQFPPPAFVNPISESVFSLPDAYHNHDKINFHKFPKVRPEKLESMNKLLAIDTEFVVVSQEEWQELADGTKKLVKPQIHALARVSILSTETEEGECIIDDFIAMDESNIKDFVTQYSGIRPGDLDPNTSQHHITSLKHSYLKLRYFVDHGFVFIGHGLVTDLKIMSMFPLPTSSHSQTCL